MSRLESKAVPFGRQSPEASGSLLRETALAEVMEFIRTSYAAILACLPLLILLFKIVRAAFDPLRDIPGPFLARFTRLWMFYTFWTEKTHDRMRDLHKKYGPVVRVAPGKYSFNDAEANKVIFSHSSKFIKSDWYKVFSHPKFEGIFNVRDPIKHATIRRKVAGVYSMTSVVAYEPFAKECTRIMLQHLDKLNGESIDLMHWNQCYAFDMAGMATFSHRFGFLDRFHDEMGFIAAIKRSSRQNMLIGIYPILYPWLNLFLALIYGRRSVTMVGEYSDAQISRARKHIEEEKRLDEKGEIHFEAENAPNDFISRLMRMEEDKNSRKGITPLDIRITAAQNMSAGSDTTGITLTAIMYHLIQHPHMLARLRKEIEDATVGMSDPEDYIPFSVGQKMPYLQACIKEGMRMHPAAGVPMPRLVPLEGAVIMDRFYPGGSIAMVNAWVAHMNTDIWGSDASEFNPDRWLEGRAPADIQFLSFGQGVRSCLGRHVAGLEMTTLIPTLFMRYEFELVPGYHDRELDTYSNVFAKPKDVMCTVHRRRVKN